MVWKEQIYKNYVVVTGERNSGGAITFESDTAEEEDGEEEVGEESGEVHNLSHWVSLLKNLT